jgi:GntR family transcriptional regulator
MLDTRQISIDELQIKPFDPGNPVPLYYQVEENLRVLLTSDRVQVGDLMPTELQLADAYGVGRHTIRTALGRLVNEGLITRKAGRGTVVAAQADRKQFSLAQSFSRQMEEMGLRPHSKVLLQQKHLVEQGDPRQLVIRKLGAEVLILERLRFGDDDPIGLQRSYIVLEHCPGLEMFDFNEHSLYDLFSNQYQIKVAQITHTVTAAIADKRRADLLEIEQHAPLLVVNSCSLLESGEIIEYGTTYYRADKYEYTMTHLSP